MRVVQFCVGIYNIQTRECSKAYGIMNEEYVQCTEILIPKMCVNVTR